MANDHADPRMNLGRRGLDAVAINDVIHDVSSAIVTTAVVMWNEFAGVAVVAVVKWNAPPDKAFFARAIHRAAANEFPHDRNRYKRSAGKEHTIRIRNVDGNFAF